jgi:predicted ATPase
MPNEDSDRFVVITGGPGSGKTTVIEALGVAGHATMPEAGRAVIRAEMVSGGTGLPWRDRERFAALMQAYDRRSYKAAQVEGGRVFFDRGLPDIVGYLNLCGLPVPKALDEVCKRLRYRETVFIAPPWPEIYAQDDERKQDLAEAERTFAAMRAVYPRYGYRLVELPKVGAAERAAFVISFTGSDRGK